MSITTQIALFCLLLAAPRACQAVPVEYPRNPNSWSVVTAPVVGSDNLNRANWSLCQWHLSLRNGRPLVTLDRTSPRHGKEEHSALPFKIAEGKAFFGRKITTKVDDGWLVEFNAGEFGASLWWFSPDGHRCYKISNDQVNEFLHTPSGLVAVQGLAHLTLSYGSVVHLTKTAQGLWKSTVFALLRDAPETAAHDADGSLVVVGASKLMRVFPSGRVQVLVSDAAWWTLYPDSIIRVGKDEFFVGMRAYVVHITTTATGARVTWLLPSRTFLKTGPTASL